MDWSLTVWGPNVPVEKAGKANLRVYGVQMHTSATVQNWGVALSNLTSMA